MAKAHQNPTHLPIVFTRNTWMRWHHVAGTQAPEEGQSLMIIVKKGEEKKITFSEAIDLTVAETGIRADKFDNKERIADLRQEVLADAEREKRTVAKQAKPATIEDKMDAFFEKMTAFLTGGKKSTA
jgi:hypothetical protein